ncbi:MAG: YjfB family protein [Methylovulum sp.]|nr:YjfB family protein [Methylovulum sp.]
MLDSVSSIAAFATQLSTQKTAQQIDIAVLKKAQDIQVQQGKAALQLIASSTVSANSIDVHV